MSNSYNGWPVLPPTSDLITTIEPVPGRKFRVRGGAVATVLDHVIRRFHNEVEPIDTGVLDDWSYNYRLVRESNTSWSNHASGTAVDLNATKHPFKTQATSNFTSAQIAAAHRIVEDLAPVVRWIEGSDPMHWEINYTNRGGTAENVERVANLIIAGMAQVTPADPLVAHPADQEPREPRVIDWKNPSPEFTRIVQEIIGAKVDGVRGPNTIARTRSFQRLLRVTPYDGKWGAQTTEAYLLTLPNLKLGDKGPGVKLLQWLVWATPDGDFGPGTEENVKAAQRWADLTPDGIAGRDTKRDITR